MWTFVPPNIIVNITAVECGVRNWWLDLSSSSPERGENVDCLFGPRTQVVRSPLSAVNALQMYCHKHACDVSCHQLRTIIQNADNRFPHTNNARTKCQSGGWGWRGRRCRRRRRSIVRMSVSASVRRWCRHRHHHQHHHNHGTMSNVLWTPGSRTRQTSVASRWHTTLL